MLESGVERISKEAGVKLKQDGGGGVGREEGRVSQRRRKQCFLSGIGAVAWSSRSRHGEGEQSLRSGGSC